jgi:hypothetical protein
MKKTLLVILIPLLGYGISFAATTQIGEPSGFSLGQSPVQVFVLGAARDKSTIIPDGNRIAVGYRVGPKKFDTIYRLIVSASSGLGEDQEVLKEWKYDPILAPAGVSKEDFQFINLSECPKGTDQIRFKIQSIETRDYVTDWYTILSDGLRF